jgi:ketosteroid isomerase-like protein
MSAGLVLALLFLAVPAGAQDARAGIEAANKNMSAVFAKGNGAAVAALYTAQAELLPANSDIVSGTAAIGAFWQKTIDSGVKGVNLKTVEVESHGTTAHEVGMYELVDAGGQTLDKGKYLVVWKQEGGTWKLHRDIWTTSMPAAK